MSGNFLSRRDAILLGAGAAASPLVLGSGSQAAISGGLGAYAVNVESWWTDRPFLDRFALAADAGFEAVEMWAPEGEDRNPLEIAKRLADTGLVLVQFLAWYGPSLAAPEQTAPFLEALKRSSDIADTLGAEMFTVVGHQNVEGLSMAEQLARLQGAYEAGIPIMERTGKTMLLEPFNEFNHPGHFIYGSPEALGICRAVHSPHLKLNWDLFHMQRHEGEVVQRLRDGIDQVAYVQLADAPDRHQPGTGEMNYEYILREARAAGYSGFFGLECWPMDGDDEKAIEDVRKVAP